MTDDLQTFDPCPDCGAQGEQLRGHSRYECEATGCTGREPESPAFEWQCRSLGTIGSLMDEMSRIHKADDHDEAQRFMAAYRSHTPHADSHVGYLTGYMDRETMREMQAMFGAAHPVFGTRTDVTADEAFETGKKMAR